MRFLRLPKISLPVLLTFVKKRQNVVLLTFFSLLFIVLMINAFHESYPDEFDNILGGKYILQGIPIYTGFFTHHGPFAYFLAAFIMLFSGGSFVLFRVVFTLVLFSYLTLTYVYVKNRFGYAQSNFYLAAIGILALAGNYYWLHMFLADTLSAYLFAPVVSILLLATYYKMPLKRTDLLLITFLTSFSVLSSLTYIYLSLLIYAYAFFAYLKDIPMKFWLKKGAEAVGIFAVPYGIFLLYLGVTMSFKEYFFQAWNFNQHYYVYNYPRPEGTMSINPLRFAVVIANAFYNNYFALLQQVKDINIGFPLNITMAAGTFSMVLYALSKKYYAFTAFLLGALIYSNSRSNPLDSKETDYQSAVYIMIAAVVIPFLLLRLSKEINEHKHVSEKIAMGFILVLVGFYSLFSSLFLFQKFFNRTYDKYMGKAALIYDRPEIAPILDRILTKEETVWIGPFEFAELFYSQNKPASRYQIFIPGMGYSPEIKNTYVAELEKTKPPVIYFQQNFFILGRNPEMYGQFFIDYLKEYYVKLGEYEKDGKKYRSTVPVSEKIDLEGRLYIRQDRVEEIIKRLEREGMVRTEEIQ